MEATLEPTARAHALDEPAREVAHAVAAPRPYTNPYLAGIGLGGVLLSAFVLVGRGLGASGAVTAVVAWLASLVAPGAAHANGFLGPYLADGHPLQAWLVFEVIGVATGAVISGALAHRIVVTIERGPRISVRGRLALAFTGGALMAIGAHLARGCTSGQALSGGSLLNLGSWAFMMCVFGGAYAAAWFLRRQWR